jgi:hypothetical protein
MTLEHDERDNVWTHPNHAPIWARCDCSTDSALQPPHMQPKHASYTRVVCARVAPELQPCNSRRASTRLKPSAARPGQLVRGLGSRQARSRDLSGPIGTDRYCNNRVTSRSHGCGVAWLCGMVAPDPVGTAVLQSLC